MKAVYLTTAEVARRVGMTPAGVRQLANAGKISCSRTGSGVRLFDPSDVELLVERRAASVRSETPPVA